MRWPSIAARFLGAGFAIVAFVAASGPGAGQTFAAARASANSASARLQRLASAMHAARLHGDWAAFRAGGIAIEKLVNGSPDAMIDVARADVHLGKSQRALAELRSAVSMGVDNDAVATLKDFATLRSSKAFSPISAAMRANIVPVSSARRVLQLDDAGLVPEDLAYDEDHHRFFLSSVRRAELVTAGFDGATHLFARSPERWPMFAVTFDRARAVVWATESAVDGFATVPRAEWGRTAVLLYDATNGVLRKRIEGPRGAQFGDAALAPDGSLLLCDGAGGGIYMAHANSAELTRLDSGDWISPQTPVFVDAHRVLVPDYARGIALFDLVTRRVRWLDMQNRFALEGIDGAALHGRDLIVVQNGTMPQRVAIFTLSSDYRRVVSASIVDSGTRNLDPTHVVSSGSTAYFIGGSGWNDLDASGHVTAGSVLGPASIMRASM